ncbi:MAG TPA: DUF2141 domain-containing protein [Erythrobacter sp.]|nr:DUF2141 domain-containing protein [Erythrobacter sp.]
MIAGLLVAVPLIGAPAQEPPHGAGVSVSIQVTELRNTKGVVRACMSPDPKKFPRCQGDPAAYRAVVKANDAGEIRFTGVTPGRYAIALLHDENDNGKADRALGMMPKEGYGFSRDAKVRMGPPKFEEAAIDIGTSPVSQSIRMRYML